MPCTHFTHPSSPEHAPTYVALYSTAALQKYKSHFVPRTRWHLPKILQGVNTECVHRLNLEVFTCVLFSLHLTLLAHRHQYRQYLHATCEQVGWLRAVQNG